MRYDVELQFFKNLLQNLDLPVHTLSAVPEENFQKEMRIYSCFSPDLTYAEFYKNIIAFCQPNCIYHIYDDLFCNYLLFQLPEAPEPSYLLIGPYTKVHITKKAIFECANRLDTPPTLYAQLEKFYMDLRLIADENTLLSLLNTFGTVIWKDLDNFTWKESASDKYILFSTAAEASFAAEYDDPHLEVKRLEDTYQLEREFLQAVSVGQAHKAELLMSDYMITRMEPRISDPIRNIKNYSIILNTLLRKTVENAGVHPIHIDRLSSAFAKKIELLTSLNKASALHKEMIHKYCLLVKNHSLKSYSPLVKKVITNVDADLTTDLSLKAQAKMLNVNASYLSTLFRKEMGITLTEYVNKNRISHAVMLLNTTNMQIQLIAQYCGIPDVNYFTKMFKKYIGKTPQQYRKNISAPMANV